MFKFEVLKKSQKSNARLGKIITSRGIVNTPAFIFCATKANVRGVTIDHIKSAGSQIISSNAYHLMLQPGGELIKEAGGLHKFMGWEYPIFTDSGGFQIFSLGYGGIDAEIKGTQQLKKKRSLLKLTEEGAQFRSNIDGKTIVLTPELSMKIQMDLGADIIVSLDECVPCRVNKLYTANSMEKSKRWAARSLNFFREQGTGEQAILAVIQGGVYKDLRQESARFANENEFHGFAIGGSLGKTKKEMFDVVETTSEMLNKSRYVHLLGIGEIEDIFHGVKCGIDTFDCVTPTRIARRGAAIVKKKDLLHPSQRYLNLGSSAFEKDFSPISCSCDCYTCRNFSRAYIRYLIKAGENLAGALLTIHNVRTMNKLMEDIRESLITDSLDETIKEWLG